jgi:phosphoenolpyruvate carboxylase
MRRVGISAEEALDWLKRVLIVPVFTAHPTEVARRSVMFKRRRIGDFLATLDRIPVPEQDLVRLEQLVLAEITSLWQTDEVRSRRPTVYDEIKMGLDYYDVSIFETLPSLYREISEALKASYGLEIETLALPQVLSLRLVDWRRPRRQSVCDAAGDARCDQLARGHLLTYYQGQLQQIIDLLTTSAQQQPVSAELQKRLYSYIVQVNAPEGRSSASNMSLSTTGDLLICIKARVERTIGAPGRAAGALPEPYTLVPSEEQAGAGAVALLQRG